MFINLNKSDEKEKIKETLNKMKNDNELQFWIGNPSVDLINGVLHFHPFVASPKKEESLQVVHSNMLSIVSIPTSKDVTELYEMFKEFQHEIQVMRVLKTSYNHHYAMIIKFDTIEAANSFYLKNNQKRFNSIEKDVCILRDVEKVEMKEKTDSSLITEPRLVKDSSKSTLDSNPDDIFSLALGKDSKEIKREWQSITAYESQYHCPICLDPILETQKSEKAKNELKKVSKAGESSHNEPIDSSPHIISILCGHFFHITCLEKWNDSKCPVCRYHQHPLEKSKCDFCGISEGLWMCIICGFIGCAPDGPMEGHIKEHYDISKHIYAVELETKGVFDFSKKGLVQRLLQNIRDGKIIQHESTPNSNDKVDTNEELEKRLDTVIYEYNLLLSSQYQSQKEYYQEQLRQASREHEQKIRRQEEEIKHLQEDKKIMSKKFKEAEGEFEENKREFYSLKEVFVKLDTEKKELEKLNNSLANQQKSQINKHKNSETSQLEELNALREEVAAITTQIKDLEAHIVTKNKLQKAFSKEGVDSGSAHILLTSTKPSKGKKKK